MKEVLKSFQDETNFSPETEMERELLEMRSKMEAGLLELGKTGYIVLQRYNRVGTNYHDYLHIRISGMLNGHRVLADKTANLEEREWGIDIEKEGLLDASAEEKKKFLCADDVYLEIDGENLSRNVSSANKFWDTYSKFAFDIDRAMELHQKNEETKAEEEKFSQGEKFAEDVLF